MPEMTKEEIAKLFEGAPEGATHFAQVNARGCPHVWYKIEDDCFFFVYSDDLARGDTWEIGVGRPGHQPLIKRPDAWNGEGLPPVGTVCEVFNNDLSDPEWEKCTILFSGKHRIVYDSESCCERVGYIDCLKFRPIKTQERIAAEEREKAIKEMCEHGVDAGDSTIEMTCAALHDAGYRKPEGGAQ